MWKFFVVTLAALALLSSTHGAPASASTKINPNLLRTLRTKSTANIFVSMTAGVKPAYDVIALNNYATRQERATAAYKALNELAEESQREILEMLASPRYFALQVQSFWISNQIYVQGADLKLVELLATLESVSRIDEEEIVYLDDPVMVGEPLEAATLESRSWGIDKIQAPEAWAYLDGNNGAGAVVGTIDTGARVTHQALRDSFKGGNHAWFNAYSTAQPLPHDGQGHGTHVTGTLTGGYGIGVAPGAKWMSCKGLRDDGSGTQAGLLACGQFFACPHDYTGNNPDCNEVPDVVSCSWGGAGGNVFFESTITAWRNAAIIPVFANGNDGNLCRTTGSPADSVRVISVGATDETDAITNWSSRGPSNGGADKPDLSAPGSLIMSASHTSDTTYVMFSGTSMACPHVAGLATLLRSKSPGATYLRVRNAMINSAERNLNFSGQVCNFRPDDQFPNYQFGYGRINALRAVQELQKMMNNETDAGETF